MRQSPFHLHDLETSAQVDALKYVNARPFGCLIDSQSATLFSGFWNAFRCVHVAVDANSEPRLVATANLRIEGGLWLGPIEVAGYTALISIGNDVRVWEMNRLLAQATAAVEAQVGQVWHDGEPLRYLSAPSSGAYFTGLSILGNLRVWLSDGQELLLHQVVSSITGSSVHDFDYIQMVDFAGVPLYVTAGSSGVVQCWQVEGKLARPLIRTGETIDAFYVHVTGDGLIACLAVGSSDKYRVAVWNLLSGKEISAERRFAIDGYEDKRIEYVAAIDDGECTVLVAAIGSPYHRLSAWNLHTGKHLWAQSVPKIIKCVVPVHVQDLHAIALGDVTGWIYVLRAADGKVLARYQAHQKGVAQICSMQLGGRDVLISASEEGKIFGVDPVQEHSFTLDIGDRITALAKVADTRLVVGTEQGFILFQLSDRAFA